MTDRAVIDCDAVSRILSTTGNRATIYKLNKCQKQRVKFQINTEKIDTTSDIKILNKTIELRVSQDIYTKIMNVYKDFIYHIRKLEFGSPYLVIREPYPTSKLKHYVKLILEIPLEDGKYHVYYGELKKLLNSFLRFYMASIRRIARYADRYTHTLNYDQMMQLYDDTINHQESLQRKFNEEFQPIETAVEQERFDAINSQYSTFRKELVEFGDRLRGLTKQYKIDEFAKHHFEDHVLQRAYQLCEFSHVFISKMLAERIGKIRISLEELVHGIQRNMIEFSKKYDDKLTSLYNELYDLNKEQVYNARDQRRCMETSEVAENIRTVKRKIEKQLESCPVQNRLIEENEHWTRKLTDFEKIAAIIAKVKAALDKVTLDCKLYDKYEVAELPGEKSCCWKRIGENYSRMKADLEEQYIQACRPLITFFACRGIDRILYSDLVGSYNIDEYGHQNYITDYGAKIYHVDCLGNFLENIENEKYYFDERGRYVMNNGEKLYQLAPCTSRIKLTEGGFLRLKHPCECREFICPTVNDPTLDCPYTMHDLTDTTVLPTIEPVDIKHTLDTKTVNYLWNSFGWILPDILNQVIQSAPNNPIHYFAHLLLTRYHSMAKNVKVHEKKEGIKYRDDVLQARRDKIAKMYHAWKAKQYKPCNVAEFDTKPQDDAYKAYQDAQKFTANLQDNYYN